MNQHRYIERQKIQNSQTERVVADVLLEETNSPYEERNQDQAELLQNQPEIEELVREIKKVYVRAEWENVKECQHLREATSTQDCID